MTQGEQKVTCRAIVLGMVLSFLAALMAHYSVNVVHGSWMAIDHMPVAAISLFFFLLVCLFGLAAVLRRPLRLSASELLIIYIMSFVACSVTTMGFGSQILPLLGAPHYYATAQNKWTDVVLPEARPWLFPQDKEAIRGFFEGVGPDAPVPWGVWIGPLLCWLPFLLALYTVMICVPVIMRKQWLEKERLAFPLAQLPVEMVKRDAQSGKSVFFRNKLMWLGFALPFIISGMRGLNTYFPWIPGGEPLWTVPTFRKTQTLIFRLSFPVMGFLYLVNLDIAFSLWIFALLAHIISGIFKITGFGLTENLGIYGSREPIFNHMGVGSILVFVLYGLWMARAHLKDVFLKTFSNKSTLDDGAELLPYRFAVLATLSSLILMCVWLTLSGLPWLLAISYVIVALMLFYGLTRIVIQAGIPTLVAPGIAAPQLVSSLGTSTFGNTGLIALAWTYVYAGDIRTFVMSAASTSLRIAEEIKQRRKLIAVCMLTAVMVSICTSLAVDLRLGYEHGGLNLNRWYFVGSPQAPFNFVSGKIQHPEGPNIGGLICKVTGGGVMLVLMLLKEKILWWPLHPIGWTIGSCWLMQQLWFAIMIVWLIKALLLKYGGPKLYRNGRPFFLGMVLGQYVAAAMWFGIDLITGMENNAVFWI